MSLAPSPAVAARGRTRRLGAAWWLGLVLAAPASFAGQTTTRAQEGGGLELRALQELPLAKRRELAARAPCFDARLWRERLCDRDFQRREQAFDELVQQLGRCGEAARTVQSWSLSSDSELAWTARLALREAHRQPTWIVLSLPGSGPEAVARRLALEADQRAPMEARLRALEPIAQAIFEGNRELSLYAPRRISFRAPLRQMGAQSLQLDVAEERVVLRIVESEGGLAHERQYSAPDFRELLARHPELRQQLPGLADLDPAAAPGVGAWSAAALELQLRLDPHGWRLAPPPVSLGGVQLGPLPVLPEVLGIDCVEASEEERARAGLPAGLGLRVERTVPCTVAHDVELRRGDILVRLGGRELRSCSDIPAALAERRERGDSTALVLEFVDTNGRRRTVRWQSADGER